MAQLHLALVVADPSFYNMSLMHSSLVSFSSHDMFESPLSLCDASSVLEQAGSIANAMNASSSAARAFLFNSLFIIFYSLISLSVISIYFSLTEMIFRAALGRKQTFRCGSAI
jgi:hypothetical protein